MLNSAYAKGVSKAFDTFAIKEAGIADWLRKGVRNAGKVYFGQPMTALEQMAAGTIAKPEGLWHGALWPAIPQGGRFTSKIIPWVQRLGTLGTGYQMLQAARGAGDPNEGRLSNMLSAAGQNLGMSYGFPVGGLIGGGWASHAGSNLGKRIGRALGSKPDYPSMDWQPPQYPIPPLPL